MSDSEKDTSAAINKVVGAFRAQRKQGKTAESTGDAPAADSVEADTPETDAPETDASETDASETDAPETDAAETDATGEAADDTPEAEADDSAADEPARPTPTPITRLDGPAPTPKGGGGSEAPTKAFKVPAAAAAAKGDESANTDEAPKTDEAEKTDEAQKPEADVTDSGDGLREETVVGDPISAEPSTDTAPADPADEKTDLVEQSIDLPADDESTPTEVISASEVAAAAEKSTSKDQPGADESPTSKMAVPAAAGAAAAAGVGAAAAAGKSGGSKPEPSPSAKPEPQVVAPAKPKSEKRASGKLIAILLAVVVVIIVIAIGLWYLLVGSSDQSQVADAAKSYQKAMNKGDLDKLRDLTCGEKNAYYSSVSPEEFQKAFDAQTARNEMMTFEDVKAVQIDGDLARVGVDMHPNSDPSKTAPAQITLHKIDGEWKVCTKP